MRVAFVALLLLAGCAAQKTGEANAPAGPSSASAGQSAAARAVEALQAELGPFRRTGSVMDVERLPGGAGLGASVRYVPANGEGLIATVYIYDRGQHRQPDGGDSPDVTQELHAATAELNTMVRMGRFRSVAFETGMNIGATPPSHSVRCATFRIVQQGGTTTGDSVCVTVQRGRFVKVRLTSSNPPEPVAAGLAAAALMSKVLEAPARSTGR